MKVKGITNKDGLRVLMVFWCPGCAKPHPYRVARDRGEDSRYPVWSFNGDQEKPTFTPSLLVHQNRRADGTIEQPLCHLFLTNGVIQYCSDSQHALAGQSVPCPEWDDERW